MQKQVINNPWSGRFTKPPAKIMQTFSASITFDTRLYPYDLQGSEAHIAMLAYIGLLKKEEYEDINVGLKKISREIVSGSFIWNKKYEDVHMNIEQKLTSCIPTAAKLHSARSRNDQVVLDMRLFLRDSCRKVISYINSYRRPIIKLAARVQNITIPGYTHLQRAQLVSMCHYFLAYIEMLGRDADRFIQIGKQATWCPLGSCALAGTTLPIDRGFVANRLGFGYTKLTSNSMDAVSDRDLHIEFVVSCTIVGTHISRLSEDMILWNSSEFSFVSLPDDFTTGSSLMPQKKNPDSFELLRGKASILNGHVTTLFSLIKGLPLTYNRDLQEDKVPVFDSFDLICFSLKVLSTSLKNANAKEKPCARAITDTMLFTTDLVDNLVRKGIPFRTAHLFIGALVALAEKKNSFIDDIKIDPSFEMDWCYIFNCQRSLAQREKNGMGGPSQVGLNIDLWYNRLNYERQLINGMP